VDQIGFNQDEGDEEDYHNAEEQKHEIDQSPSPQIE